MTELGKEILKQLHLHGPASLTDLLLRLDLPINRYTELLRELDALKKMNQIKRDYNNKWRARR